MTAPRSRSRRVPAAATVVLGVVAVLAVVGGCRPDPSPEVALLLSDRAGVRAEHVELRAHARDLGIHVLAFTAGDLASQTAQVESALAAGVRILVIEPVEGPGSVGFVTRAHELGARVVAYDRPILADALDAYVAHDRYRAGVLQAEAALAATGGTGRFVLLAGPSDEAATIAITRGHEHTLAPYVARGDVEIAVRGNHARGTEDETAARSLEDARRRGPIHAVLASSSELAAAAVRELDRAGSGDVFVAGAGAAVANLNLVCQGKQAVEILASRAALARGAAEVAHRLLRGDDLAPDTSALELDGRSIQISTVRVELITPELVRPRIVEAGLVDARELPACADRLVAGPAVRPTGS